MPAKTPEPIIAGEKREPSSFVQLTTVRPCRSTVAVSFSVRINSTPARTPRIPSNLPPCGWVSRWLPTAIGGSDGSSPG
ncbi:hypothetical protein D3C87_1654940 [compost metagenome]